MKHMVKRALKSQRVPRALTMRAGTRVLLAGVVYHRSMYSAKRRVIRLGRVMRAAAWRA